MTPTARLLLFGGAGAVLTAVFVLGVLGAPDFGAAGHLYRDLAVTAAVDHHTANVVSAVNFDQRAIDTFGEETILIASTVGAVALLRPSREETVRRPATLGRTLESTRMIGYVLMPVTLVIGADVVLHGGITPGGGFQGGVMTAGEVAAFEQRPDRDDLVALRRADDAAKIRHAPVDPLESWRPAVEHVIASIHPH